MIPTVTIDVTVQKVDAAASRLQRVRNALADRRHLNAAVAMDATNFTRDFLSRSSRHATAQRLGAEPSGHMAKAAKLVHSDSNAELAMVRMPRATGLGRAFHDILIVPGNGRTYLTIPADKRTYGRRCGEFPVGTFVFAIIGGRYPVLMFKEGWTVAYWLRRKVLQKQDRTLLPSSAAYAELGGRSTRVYIKNLINGTIAG